MSSIAERPGAPTRVPSSVPRPSRRAAAPPVAWPRNGVPNASTIRLESSASSGGGAFSELWLKDGKSACACTGALAKPVEHTIATIPARAIPLIMRAENRDALENDMLKTLVLKFTAALAILASAPAGAAERATAPEANSAPAWCIQRGYVRRMQGGVLSPRQINRCAVTKKMSAGAHG